MTSVKGVKMTKKFLSAVAAASILAFAANPASAKSYVMDYTSYDKTVTAKFVIDASDALDVVGGHDVLGISGYVGGDAITGLTSNPNQPNVATSQDDLWWYDNVVRDGAPIVDVDGLLFKTRSGAEYNFWSNSPTEFELYSAKNGSYGAYSLGTLAAAPEPAAWAMMILGMGAVGAMLRRQRPWREAEVNSYNGSLRIG
jgi:hypothetical protein